MKKLRFISMLLALGMLVLASAAVAQEPEPEVCTITQSTNDCGPVELCGPEGESAYRWTGPGLPTEGVETRCITVTMDGTYFLETYNAQTEIKSECDATVDVKECEAPPCDITSSLGDTICDEEKTELCGPEGDYEYLWSGPGVDGATTRCVSADQAGTYGLQVTDPGTELSSRCAFELMRCQDPPPCRITSSEGDLICDDEKTELCGPEGDYEYLWSGPGVEGETTRCVSASEAGTYKLTVTDPGTKLSSMCEYELKTEECRDNCPRTPGYWRQQAEQKGNGSTKFSRADAIAIAECVDARVDHFSWGSGESALSNFRQVLTPGGSDWTQKKQAMRHLAALVANVCASGYTPTHGGDVYLSESTEFNCNGSVYTIGMLIDKMDMALQDDEGYHEIAGCLDAINNGRGIGTVCDGKKEEANKDGTRGGFGLRDLSGSVQLYRPFPNPTTGSMRMSFAVAGSGQTVDIGVYDIAGRLVQKLASGFRSGGIHQVEWNGLDLNGGRAGAGIYFVRTLVDGQQLRNTRIIMAK